MRVLVLGSSGFIGGHIASALQRQGHAVVRGVSARHAANAAEGGGPDRVTVDLARDVDAAAWRPRLVGIDAVVNAVGVLRDTRARPMQAVHTDAPCALFDACVDAGASRVIHISALGIADNASAYATTKRAAEDHLLGHTDAGRLQATVVRPSVVFGQGGESTALFLSLARLPLAILPAVAWRAQMQPVHVRELAEGVAQLLAPHAPGAPLALPRVSEAVGPEALPLVQFIASLRQQLGHQPARMWPLPDGLTRLSARMGDLLPISPWGSEALSLLSQDNVGNAGDLTALLGRAPTHYSHLLGVEAGARPQP